MKKLIHRLTFHYFGLAGGTIESWYAGNSIWHGFRCSCGDMLGEFTRTGH